jgi:hypothetical protein
LAKSCGARTSGAPSGTFAVRGPGGIPAEPDGWLRAPELPEAAATAEAAPALPILAASLSGLPIAPETCE